MVKLLISLLSFSEVCIVFRLYKIDVIGKMAFKNSRCPRYVSKFSKNIWHEGMLKRSLRHQGAPSLGKLNGVGQTCIFV